MAMPTSSYQSELFYCRCPEGTNHLQVDVEGEGMLWRNDANTFWHILTEAPQNEPKLTIKQITNVTRKIPQAISNVLEMGYGISSKEEFVGRMVKLENSSFLSPNALNRILNRSYANDDQMPIYEGSFPLVLPRTVKEQNHRILFHRIKDEKTEMTIENAIKVDRLRQKGDFELADEYLSSIKEMRLLKRQIAAVKNEQSDENDIEDD